jgi:hypothetical protein
MDNKKIANDMKTLVKNQLVETITEFVESLKEVIVSSYDSALGGVMVSPGSRINLQDIKASLIEQLNQFNYMSIGNTVDVHVPDMENFNFSKNPNLRLLKTILEGVVGVYVLVDGKEFVSIYGHKPINEETLEESFAPAEMLYLVSYSPKVQSIEAKLKKKFTKYPFSNMPPVRLFEEGERLDISPYIDKAISEAEKKFVNSYKGAN